MASQAQQLHFILFPMMAQGHMIPMMDIAKLLAQRSRGVVVTVVTTTHNAARFERSVGGFLTHCGWNSIIESISAGVPMLTWPLFGDQFMNEKLVVQVQKIGVRVGVEDPVKWGEEEKTGVLVEKEDVKAAIDMLMDDGEEREERRKRARELGEMAKRAVADGGSSHVQITQLIQEIMQQASCEEST